MLYSSVYLSYKINVFVWFHCLRASQPQYPAPLQHVGQPRLWLWVFRTKATAGDAQSSAAKPLYASSTEWSRYRSCWKTYFSDKSSLWRAFCHPADFSYLLKSSVCRDILNEKPYFCVQLLYYYFFVHVFFFFSVNQLRSLLQKQSKDANVQSPSPSKRKLAGKVLWLLCIA